MGCPDARRRLSRTAASDAGVEKGTLRTSHRSLKPGSSMQANKILCRPPPSACKARESDATHSHKLLAC